MKTGNNSRKSKSPMLLIVMCLTALFTVFCFAPQSHAEEGDGGQVSVVGKVCGFDGNWSSATEPASMRFAPHPIQLTPRLFYRVGVDYKGLDAGKEYIVSGKWYLGLGEYELNWDIGSHTFTAAEGGEGTWESRSITDDITFWRQNWTGDGRIELTLTPADGSSDPIIVEPDGQSMSLKYKGISYMELNGETGREVAGMRYEVLDELSEETKFTAHVKMVNLDPDTEYTITAWCSKVTGWKDSWIWFPQRVSDNTHQTVRSDEKGGVIFEPEYDIDTSKLSPNTLCISMFTVKRTDGQGPEYWFYPKGYPNIYYYIFRVAYEPMIYLIKDKEAVNTPAKVDVVINNYVENKDVLIPGAEFKIVEGKDPDGKAVETWIQKKGPYKTILPPGDYTLVQTKAPAGYKIASPISFTLTNNDATSRNYSFLSDRRLAETPDGEKFYHMSIYKFDEDKDARKHEVVYCINHERNYYGAMDPSAMELMYYTEYDISDDVLGSIVDDPRVETDALRTKLKQIALGGYPNDRLGLKKKHSLSSYELMAVTQAAIHYYTDSMPYTNEEVVDGEKVFPKDNMYDAFLELINTDIHVPDGMTLKIYIPDNDKLQSVLSTVIRDEISIVNVDIENSQVKGVSEDKKSVSKEVGDVEITSKKNSSTGDESHLYLILLLLLISSAGFAWTIGRRRV